MGFLNPSINNSPRVVWLGDWLPLVVAELGGLPLKVAEDEAVVVEHRLHRVERGGRAHEPHRVATLVVIVLLFERLFENFKIVHNRKRLTGSTSSEKH